MKKAIRYLRFSSDGQSQHSIERQNIITAGWIDHNKIELIDTFIDEGYSAKTFDRPDMKALISFIKKNHRNIDYLVVSELTRFSRDAGDAIEKVKELQAAYDICIVSASRSCIYDVNDSNSFFMMGLEFLLGNSENIKRQNDINGGIYAAKQAGRWIQGGPAPYGFKKVGTGKERSLVIEESQAVVVRFIYQSFLNNTPEYIIIQQAKQMGFNRKGGSAVHDILRNPLYMGYQFVKPYKDYQGGLMPLTNFTPIIEPKEWNAVQEKFKRKYRVTVADTLPLRGVLKCWCGDCVTGAPSRGKSGKYYDYYKCRHPRHNNISATKAHDQLKEILQLMSLPEKLITAIKVESKRLMRETMQANASILSGRIMEANDVDKKLHSVESKFIEEQIDPATYHKWHRELTEKKLTLKSEISQLQKDENQLYFLLEQNLMQLSDMHGLYVDAGIVQKQELVRQVFDSRLYYKEQTYRTPYIMETFSHNLLTLKEKQLLILDGYSYSYTGNPVRWRSPSPNRTLFSFLEFIASIKAA